MDWAVVLKDVDFGTVFDGIESIIPVIIAPMLTWIGARKGWGFLKRQAKGA